MPPIATEAPDSSGSEPDREPSAVVLEGAPAEADDLLAEFLLESDENLDQLDSDLMALERDPSDGEALSSLFRTIHTIKGTCGFFGFSKLEALAHAGESLLSRLRDGETALTAEISNTLLATFDAVREILASIESQRDEGANDYSLLLAALARLNGCEGANSSLAPEEAEAEPARFGDILVQTGRVQPDALAQALAAQKEGDARFLGEILVDAGALRPADIADALLIQEESRSAGLWDNSVRVDLRLLDQLIDLVGELVLTRNQLLQIALSQENAALLATSARLNRITTELQEGVNKTRLQPIGSIWSKLPRLVRDLAVGARKQVRLEMEGREIELGRGVIEAIKDPILHLVRNAVDHGIELPEERVRTGKLPEGRLLLRACCDGEQVQVELGDDGAGIDLERIRAKAIQRGLVPAAQIAQMPDTQLAELIFLPGFSTAERITHVSGRGVGMDIVKIKIEKIGGSIQIESRRSEGTMIRMRIPRTLSTGHGLNPAATQKQPR
jgi:two-component system, chemotaxis family, sensor kinase CheA